MELDVTTRNRHLYEIFWQVETDLCSFLYREFKVFSSDAEVKQYGMRPEEELNGGESIEVRAQDGYYFKYRGACKVTELMASQSTCRTKPKDRLLCR